MHTKYLLLSLYISLLVFIHSCSPNKSNTSFEPKIVYQSEALIITQLSEHTYQHTSYLSTKDFGRVDCNGMVVQDEREAIVFDTPADSLSSIMLLNWIQNNLNSQTIAVIATHFHVDCLGGLNAFHKMNIPSYANYKTIDLAKLKGFCEPINGFQDTLILKVGKEQVIAKYFGEGHTRDNVIGYFPSEKIMFGGCLIKEKGASKGNLEDANVAAWSPTVQSIKNTYPEVELIIPGHGKFGDRSLLDYTIQLFNSN